MSVINSNPCDKCIHYDPVMRGAKEGGVRETRWAWCAKKSKYPAKEGPGQRFPSGVERVEPGERAQPFIVKKDQVIANCTEFYDRGTTPTKLQLLKLLQDKTS